MATFESKYAIGDVIPAADISPSCLDEGEECIDAWVVGVSCLGGLDKPQVSYRVHYKFMAFSYYKDVYCRGSV